MSRIVNLTPHEVNVAGVTLPPSGSVARCAEVVDARGQVEVDGTAIPLVARRFGAVEGLPAPEPGVLYLTSALVAQAAWAAGRTDVVAPGELVRDETGRVVGAVNLAVGPGWSG